MKRLTEDQKENLAQDIIKFLMSKNMWVDTTIYVNGKSYNQQDEEGYHYNKKVCVHDDQDPRRSFEYVFTDHILSMSFEGPLYRMLNNFAVNMESVVQSLFTKCRRCIS